MLHKQKKKYVKMLSYQRNYLSTEKIHFFLFFAALTNISFISGHFNRLNQIF